MRERRAWDIAFCCTILLISFVFLGCSKSDCETYSDKVCEAACACTDGDQCAVAAADKSVVYVYKDKSECLQFHKTGGCEFGGDPSFNFSSCIKALDMPTCDDVPQGGDAGAVKSLLHPECSAFDAGQ